MGKHPDTIIAEAFERHCKENHQADYEVCDDLTCQAAYALERLLSPLRELIVEAGRIGLVSKTGGETWVNYQTKSC